MDWKIILILVVTYLLLGMVLAFRDIPNAKEKARHTTNNFDEQETLVIIRNGVIILLWLPIYVLAIIISVPMIIIKLYEKLHENDELE